MSKQVTIRLVETVGSVHCSASEDGQKVYEQISKELTNNNNVIISFKEVEDLTTAFLNAAIGQLYKDYSEEELKQRLSVADYEQEDLIILKRVVDRAKGFFNNPEPHNAATSEILGRNDE